MPLQIQKVEKGWIIRDVKTMEVLGKGSKGYPKGVYKDKKTAWNTLSRECNRR